MPRKSLMWIFAFLVGMSLVLSACYAPTPPRASATSTMDVSGTPSRQALPQIEVGVEKTPTLPPAEPAVVGTVWNPRAIAIEVQQALARMLHASPKDVPFIAYKPEVDPATLTCVDQLTGDVPSFGEGEALVFQYKDTKFYVISSQNALWVCRAGPLTAGERLTLEKAKEKAIQDLARRLGISATEIQVEEAKEVTWDDTSLGCPTEGQKYAKILTPGFLILLKAGDQTYAYHGSSHTIFLCGAEGR